MKFPTQLSLPDPVQKFLQHLFTGKDGETFDIGRVLWAISTVYASVLATMDVVMNHARFDIQQFGIGMAALLAGGGGALALKAKTEPGSHGP